MLNPSTLVLYYATLKKKRRTDFFKGAFAMASRNELLEELNSVLKGKGLDVLLPPLVYAISSNFFSIIIAGILASAFALFFAVVRLVKNQSILYAFGGLAGVLFALALAYLADNARNFYLPGLISSIALVVATLVSLILSKPLSAIASHLTRGWPWAWFLRKDIKPAYTETTWMWLVFFSLRTTLQLVLFLQQDITRFALFNTLLGLPVTIGVLILTYVYGLWRLQQLKGPGVDEFIDHKQPPYQGQKRGF